MHHAPTLRHALFRSTRYCMLPIQFSGIANPPMQELRGELVSMKDGIAQVKILDPMPNVTGSFRVVVDGGLAGAEGVVFSGSSEPAYLSAADEVLSVARESIKMSDEEYAEFIEFMRLTGVTRESLAADIAKGVQGGTPIEQQVQFLKAFLLGSGSGMDMLLNAIKK